MKRSVPNAVAALCVAAIGLAVPAAAQQAQPAPVQPKTALEATHGAWEIHCIEGTDTCAMQQFGETANGERALLVMVRRLAGVTSEGQPIPASLEVLAPLGVLIPYNVRVKIDQGEVQPVPLIRCLPDSCMARAPLRQQDVDQFKRGSNAKFGFFVTEEVLVDISLNGFTAAFDALKPVQVQQQQPQN